MNREFLTRDPETVAKEMLGCELVKEAGDQTMRGRIVETEAYHGPEDPASHASSGMTERNEPMFGEAGKAYVYVSYGIHYLLNVVTGREGEASAVLLRALEPLQGLEIMGENRGVEEETEMCSGPGKLTEAFGITIEDNRRSLLSGRLRIEEGESPEEVVEDTRIGISEGKELERRFYVKGSRFVSR